MRNRTLSRRRECRSTINGSGLPGFSNQGGTRVTYLNDDLLDELGQAGVNVVDNDTDALHLSSLQGTGHMPGHILLQHGLDVSARLLVAGEDGLAPEQTTLLGAVPVKLECVGMLALDDGLGLENDTECLENGHGAATIIVCAGRSQNARQPQVDRVLVRADDNRRIGLAGDRGDDGVLAPRVLEMRSRDVLLGAGSLDRVANLTQKPFARLLPVVGLFRNARVRSRTHKSNPKSDDG